MNMLHEFLRVFALLARLLGEESGEALSRSYEPKESPIGSMLPTREKRARPTTPEEAAALQDELRQATRNAGNAKMSGGGGQ